MKYRNILYSMLALLVLLCACHTEPSRSMQELEQIDSLSAQDARRAIVVLDSLYPKLVDADSITWTYYQLLRIKAQDRAYIPHTSDALILQVIDYYQRHPDADRLAWAYCYGGRVYRDLDDTPRALEYFQKSLSTLEDGSNPQLQQRVLNQIGYIFYYNFLYAESRAIKRRVIDADSLLGNYDRMVTSYTDMARCYIAEEKYDSATLVSCYASQLAEQHQLLRQVPALRLLESQIADYQGKHEEALRIVEPYLTDSTRLNITPYLSVAIRALEALGRDEAVEPLCYQLLSDKHTSQAHRALALRQLARIEQQRGRSQSALNYKDQALSCLDSLIRHETQSKVRLVSDFYVNQQRERQIEVLRQERDSAQTRFYLLCFAFISLSLAGLVLWLQYKRRRAERMLSQEKALTAFKSSELCHRIYERYYANQILPSELWDEIMLYLEDCIPEFIPKLRALTDMSETEWRLSLLTFLGYRNTEIATLLCKHRSSISVAKKRLYDKVSCSTGKAEDWDMLIQGLANA